MALQINTKKHKKSMENLEEMSKIFHRNLKLHQKDSTDGKEFSAKCLADLGMFIHEQLMTLAMTTLQINDETDESVRDLANIMIKSIYETEKHINSLYIKNQNEVTH